MHTSPTTTQRRHGRLRLGVITLAAFSLVAAACGDDGDDTAVANEPVTEQAADEPAAEPADDVGNAAEPADDTVVDTTVEMAEEPADEMAAGPFGPACSAVPADGEGSFDGMADDPAATAASNNPVLSTLVTAVTEAGLVDTLNGEGPFTIFAPTNDAFAAIPEDQLGAVLADTDLLTSILTYHVVAGQSLDAEALAAAGELETVNGATITFGADGTTVNGATVVCSDVSTANATVHIIDTVMMPES